MEEALLRLISERKGKLQTLKQSFNNRTTRRTVEATGVANLRFSVCFGL